MEIKEIKVKNFKSLKDIHLKFNKINVFIGDTNSGKSNVIELLSFLGSLINFDEEHYGTYLQKFVRFETLLDLFYDKSIEEPIEVYLKYIVGDTEKIIDMSISISGDVLSISNPTTKETYFELDFDGNLTPFNTENLKDLKFIKFYEYNKNLGKEINYDLTHKDFSLRSPHGENLFEVVWSSKDRRQFLADILEEFGYRTGFEPASRKISFIKYTEDILVTFSFPLLPDTLKGTILYYMGMLSNENSVICLDEPESFMYPSHILDIAEDIVKITESQGNQIILTTHNPYFLENLIAKTQKEHLNLFVSRYHKFRSDFRLLGSNQVNAIYEMDLILNINLFFGEEEE